MEDILGLIYSVSAIDDRVRLRNAFSAISFPRNRLCLRKFQLRLSKTLTAWHRCESPKLGECLRFRRVGKEKIVQVSSNGSCHIVSARSVDSVLSAFQLTMAPSMQRGCPLRKRHYLTPQEMKSLSDSEKYALGGVLARNWRHLYSAHHN